MLTREQMRGQGSKIFGNMPCGEREVGVAIMDQSNIPYFFDQKFAWFVT
jgi:hypothetical protein